MNNSRGGGRNHNEKHNRSKMLSSLPSFFHIRKHQHEISDLDQSQDQEIENREKPKCPTRELKSASSRSDFSRNITDPRKSFNASDIPNDKENFPLINRKTDRNRFSLFSTTPKYYKEKREFVEKKEAVEKKTKKYVGIRNQGATCYLNVILQTFFHIPAFRKLIYEIPFDIATQNQTNLQDSSHHSHIIKMNDQTNVILHLQILFAQLQKSKNAVSTHNLTNSFGWDQEQTFIQQDIVEFCNQLLDCIKNKLKNTSYEKAIDDFFMFYSRTYYRGIYVSFEEHVDDNYFVLSVVVKGFTTLNESLHSLLAVQYLRGGNQFESQTHGKQDVSISTRFLKFPKVLMIHLKRFEFDPILNENVKINSFLMFEEELDISYLLSETDQLELGTKYELHAVLVHSGYIDGGHYYAYIRPTVDPQWYKFNDSLVAPVDKSEAIENNFGGPDNSSFSLFGRSERSFSAYMLIYVRKSSLDEIFNHVKSNLISEKVRSCLIDDTEKVNRIQINIVDEQSLAKNAFKGKVSFYSSTKNMKTIYISNSLSPEELYISVASQLKIPINSFLLYNFNDEFLTSKIGRGDDKSLIRSLNDGSSLFCSEIRNDTIESQYYQPIFMFIYIRFLKHPLRYLAKTIVNPHSFINDTLNNEVKKELNISQPCNLSVHVKNGPSLTYIEGLDTKFEDYQSSLYIIDILESKEFDDIIYEKGFLQDDENKYSNKIFNFFDNLKEMPSNVQSYYDESNDKGIAELKTIEMFDSPIVIKYSNSSSFEQFVLFIRNILRIEEEKNITIYKSFDVLPILQSENNNKKVFEILLNMKYLIVATSDYEEENIALLEIIWSIDSINQSNRTPIQVRKEMTVKNILSELKNGINEFKSNDEIELRLLQMNEESSRYKKGIIRVLGEDELVCNLKNPLRVEPIPFDQLEISPENLIPVLFIDKNAKITINFLISIIDDEIFGDTKKRIQLILKKSDKSIKKMLFYFVSKKNEMHSINDDDIISNINTINSQIKIIEEAKPKMPTSDIKIYN